MPAPLGKTVTRKMPKIDVFGLDSSAATRSAIRFFRDRRIVVTYIDFAKRPLEAAELREFIDRVGLASLVVDPSLGGVTDRGVLLTRIRANPALLRLPLVRYGKELTAGPDEAAWKAWLTARQSGR